MRRLVLSLVVVLALAPPASAHGGSTARTTDYRAELSGVVPAGSGVGVRLVDDGTRIELDAGNHDVVVLGYEGEPYLRISGDGVYENQRSPSTYLNRSLSGETPPPEATAGAAPDWERIGDGPRARWHDHALHVPPGQSTGARDESRWARPITVDGASFEVRGSIVTLPARAAGPWLALAGALALVVILLGHLAWRAALIGALALLVAADAARLYGLVFGTPSWLVSRWAVATDSATLSIIGWGMGIAAVVLVLRQRRLEAAAAAAVAGGLLAVTGGLLEVGDLDAARLGSALPDALARTTIASTLGAGVGVAVGAVLELRRGSPRRARPERRTGTGPSRGDDTRTASRSVPPSG